MPRKLALALVAGLLIATPAVAASSTKTVSSTGNVNAAVVGTINGQVTVAGYVKDAKRGVGAVLFNNVGVGMGKTSPFTVFLGGGSFSGTATFDSAVNPDNTVTISNGTLAIKKGTGTLKGSTGTGTVAGSSNGAGVFTLTYTTKITTKAAR